MKTIAKVTAVFLLMFSLSGCAAQTRYVWSDYDTKLYDHYKDPAQKAEFYEALKETLDDAESSGQVPPGIYAEYGFVMYEQGNSLQAVKYYQMESDKWPESRFFMTKLIKMAQKRGKTLETRIIPANAPDAGAKQNVGMPPEVTK